MTNHPNRSKRSTARHPTPDEVKAARLASGLTQPEAAKTIHCNVGSWQKWEMGTRKMHPAMWELFQLKVGRLTQA